MATSEAEEDSTKRAGLTGGVIPDVSIIIVNYNGGEPVEQCVRSVHDNPTRRSFEVIVVDNASVDGSPERILRSYPGVRLLRRDQNYGLAKSFNHGVAAMRGRYLLSLDDGTQVLPGAIDALVDFLESHPKVGAAGARLYDPDMTIQQVARSFPHPLNAIFGRRSILAKWFPNHPLIKRYLMSEYDTAEEPFEIDWNSSAALMLRREVIDDVGAMDPRYFVYWADADWCFRIRKAGWDIFCVPPAKVQHLENLRTGYRPRPKSRMIIDFHMGAYRFYRASSLGAWWSPLALVSAVGLFVRAAWLLAANEIARRIQGANGRGGKPAASTTK